MKILKVLTACLVLPFAFLACAKKEDQEASNGGSADKADTHEIITKEYFGYMEDTMGVMLSIDSAEEAAAFVAKMTELQPKLEAILERAKALPEPTDEQKAAVKATHEEIEKRMMAKMMELGKETVANPPSPEVAEAIGEEMKKVMSGEFGDKMNAITDGVDAVYGLKE